MDILQTINDLNEAHAMLGMIQNDPKTICDEYGVEPEDLILVEQELMDRINALEDNEIKGFIESKCQIINDYNMNIEGIKTEVARLQNLMETYTKRLEKAKQSIDWIMTVSHLEKLDTTLNKISYRKSESVSVQDENLIPEEYWREKVTKSVDKTAIKEAIKSGKEVAGATIEVKNNLQIK